uniref:Uncharacterized protein n=1 Tax=Helianthus annuus TaxID=4232 RepID=A0A251SMG1_HELAN
MMKMSLEFIVEMRMSWKKCRLLGIWMTAVVWVSGSNSEEEERGGGDVYGDDDDGFV